MPKFIKIVDPATIEKQFSTEDYCFYKMSESNFNLDDFRPYIYKLPQREIDLMDLYYKKSMKQKEIATFFGISQGAVSHRLARARKRLTFLRDMPKLTQDIQKELEAYFTPFEIDLILSMIKTTCQSKTADILNDKHTLNGKELMTQVKVRHKFDRAIDKLKTLSKEYPKLKAILELVKYIKKNLYMLHEVILPHFDRGYKVRITEVH